MHRRWAGRVAVIGLLITAVACHPQQRARHGGASTMTAAAAPTADTSDEGSSKTDMTAADAIKVVKTLADNGSLTITLSLNFVTYGPQQTVCGNAEAEMDQSRFPDNPELRTCKSPNGYPPYYKTIETAQTQCCQIKTVGIPASAAWSADGPDKDGKWLVKADFGIDGQAHHAVWSLDLKTRQLGPPNDVG